MSPLSYLLLGCFLWGLWREHRPHPADYLIGMLLGYWFAQAFLL